MTPTQRDLILHDKLRGVTEWPHTDTVYYCEKCEKQLCNLDTSHDIAAKIETGERNKPCPIPDPFPGSDADIAEEIQAYIQKNFDKQQNTEYLRILTKQFSMANRVARDIGGVSLSELYFGAQLLRATDKITAFTEMFKESE